MLIIVKLMQLKFYIILVLTLKKSWDKSRYLLDRVKQNHKARLMVRLMKINYIQDREMNNCRNINKRWRIFKGSVVVSRFHVEQSVYQIREQSKSLIWKIRTLIAWIAWLNAQIGLVRRCGLFLYKHAGSSGCNTNARFDIKGLILFLLYNTRGRLV